MSKVEWYGDKVYAEYSKIINDRVLKAAMMIEREAKKSMGSSTASIMTGLRSGAISTDAISKSKKLKRGKSGKFHVASLPGGPPNVDTGRLRASVSTNHSRSVAPRGQVGPKANAGDGIGKPISGEHNFVVVVGTNVDYGKFLELGTGRKARPWLRPAFEKIIHSAKNFILSPVNK